MKKLAFYSLLLLALCTLLFAGCGDTPPEEPTIDEQITVGMSYSEIAELVGDDGEVLEISPNICIWDTGEEKDLYVWFTRFVGDAAATVTRFERRENLELSAGMSIDEIKDLFGTPGRTYNHDPYIHTWQSAGENALYVWLDSKNKMVDYIISAAPKAEVGMTYEQVTDLFDCEGTPVANVFGLYSWPYLFPCKTTYVRFADGKVTDVFIDSEISIKAGMTYERLADIYNCEGTKVGRWDNIYSWQTSEDSIGIFKFEDDNGTLKLSQFDSSVGKIAVGMTLAEINESIGTVGEDVGLVTTKAYKWDTELEENLYVWFDSDMTVTQFCYAKDDDVEVKVGMAIDDVIYIWGPSSPIRDRWVTTADTDLYVRRGEGYITEIIDIPKLDIYLGMTMEYLVEMFGKEPDQCRGSGVIYYEWILDDSGLLISVAFYVDGANSILFFSGENPSKLPAYPYTGYPW